MNMHMIAWGRGACAIVACAWITPTSLLCHLTAVRSPSTVAQLFQSPQGAEVSPDVGLLVAACCGMTSLFDD